MIRIGLTGGIASGKSSICRMWQFLYHTPIFDADKAVHELYSKADICQQINAMSPISVLKHQPNLRIDRSELAKALLQQPDLLAKIEAIIHPKIAQLEQRFWQHQYRNGTETTISDIPLLLENGKQHNYDAITIAYAPLHIRCKRAMMRPNMSHEKWQKIIANQVDGKIRLQMADFVINTAMGKAETIRQLQLARQKIIRGLYQ